MPPAQGGGAAIVPDPGISHAGAPATDGLAPAGQQVREEDAAPVGVTSLMATAAGTGFQPAGCTAAGFVPADPYTGIVIIPRDAASSGDDSDVLLCGNKADMQQQQPCLVAQRDDTRPRGSVKLADAPVRPFTFTSTPSEQYTASSPPLCDSRRNRSSPSLAVHPGRSARRLVGAVSDTGGQLPTPPSPLSRASSVMGHVDSVSDALCEWPSISTALDDHLEAGAVGPDETSRPTSNVGSHPLITNADARMSPPPATAGYSPELSPLPSPKLRSPFQPGPLRLPHAMEYAGAGPTSCTYYFRRASRSGLPELDEEDAEGEVEDEAVEQVPDAAPPRLLRSLAVTGGMYSLGTASRPTMPALHHCESFGSELGGNGGSSSNSPPLGGRSIFHTKRLLEAVVAAEESAGGAGVSSSFSGSFLNPGGIGPLLGALERVAAGGADGEGAAMAQLGALDLLSHSPANCAIVAQAGGLPLLARLLVNWGSAAVGGAAARVLATLAASASGLRPAVLAAGVMPGLLRLLRVGEGAPRVAALQALTLLADDAPGAAALRDGGATSAALQALAALDPHGSTPTASANLAPALLGLLARLSGCLHHWRAARRAAAGDQPGVAAKLLSRLDLQWITPARGLPLVTLSPPAEADFLTDLSAEMALLGYSGGAGPDSRPGQPSEFPLGEEEADEEDAAEEVLGGWRSRPNSFSSSGSLVRHLAATSVPRWRSYGDTAGPSGGRRPVNLPCPGTVGNALDRLPERSSHGAGKEEIHKVASCPVVASCS